MPNRNSKWIWSVVVLLLPVIYSVSLVPIAYGLRYPRFRLFWNDHLGEIYIYPIFLFWHASTALPW